MKVLAKITKYDGDQKEPKWMDIERGSAFDFVARFSCPVLIIQKTDSRPCAM